MNDAVRRWAEAEGLLAADPTARVRCPSCGADFLVVAEPAEEGGAGELHLTCPRCLDRRVVRRGP
jgi:uncharacterized C2H2 Zn-finger protein